MYHKMSDEIWTLEPDMDNPHGWIQWKGTDVCIDIHCACGHHGHVDGEFFYFFRCPQCKRGYRVGQNVTLYELSPEQAECVENGGGIGFTTCDLEEE